jgi:flagellar basal-body rod protein FlgB
MELGRSSLASSDSVKARDQKETYETSPSGNAVILEEQMLSASETLGEHRMMANLHEKYVKMMRAATGNR